MLKIGLTGGMGSGKSTVAAIFELLSIPVYYADAAAKQIMRQNASVRKALIAVFGQEAYTNGVPNRSWLSSQVFRDPEATARLNAIVHPATMADARAWMARQHGPYALKEAALIFESGGECELDLVIGVQAPESLRLKRVMRRDNITRDEAAQRMARQMDEAEKIRRCRFVIVNDDHTAVIPQVLQIHATLLTLRFPVH